MKPESFKPKELKEYCDELGVPVEWFEEINDILITNGMDNWHLREHHAVGEILEFIKEKVVR